MLDFFFFFSSRRRHTRSLCDWSSDVCSSDLLLHPAHQHAEVDRLHDHRHAARLERLVERVGDLGREPLLRSEEHTSELQSHSDLVCRLLLEKKKKQERKTRTRNAMCESHCTH